MCQLASDLNSDCHDRSQTTDLNNSPTCYHSTTALTAFCCLQFRMYLAAEQCARWAWRAHGGRGDIKCENCSVKSFFRKKQRINAKSEPSKCSGLAISRRRKIYAMIGVELRTSGRFSSNLEDGSVKTHLHTSPIVVKIPNGPHERTWTKQPNII